MSITDVNVGDTGLEARNTINDNFAELQDRIYILPVDGDNTENLNTAIAALPAGGGVIELKGGTEYNVSGDGLNVVDGLLIRGNGAVIGKASNMNVGKYVFEIDSDIEITLVDLTIKQNRILNQSDGTLRLKNVTFSYANAAYDAFFQTTGGNLYAENFNIDSVASSALGSSSYFGNDIMIVNGGIWTFNRLRFLNTGDFKIALNKIEGVAGIDYGVIYFGTLNTYDYVAEHEDWVALNETHTLTVVLTCPIIDNIRIQTDCSAIVTLNGGIFNEYWVVRGASYLKAINCHGLAGEVLAESGGTLELDGCYMRKDGGKPLLPYPDDVFNEDNWGTEGYYVDHIFETLAGDGLNEYNLYPTYIFRDSILEYMGDDVLNSLDDDYLLAEIEAHPTYIEDSDADPAIPPVGGTWAITTLYNEGDILLTPLNWQGGLSEKYAMIVMEDHTSSADLDDDMYAGKIRALFGANRQTNGKYQQLMYFESTGWFATIQPTITYSGGGKRNRGCGLYIIANFIIENCKFIDHAAVYSTRINCSQAITHRKVGAPAYPQFKLDPITFGYIDNLTIEYRGSFNNQVKKGIQIHTPLGVETGEYFYNNIRAVGKSMNCVFQISGWGVDYENVFKIGIMHRNHPDIDNDIVEDRYNSENFIIKGYNGTPPGYNFNDWVNYLFDFVNEKRDYIEYPI